MPDTVTPTQLFDLKGVLIKLGLSQRKLAKMLRRSQDWVSRITSGRNAPSWPMACYIARVLGVSVGVFHDNDPARQAFFTRVGPGDKPAPASEPPKKKRTAKSA